MQTAKAAVQDFLHKDGKHNTIVHEAVNPHVTNEKVTRTQHENIQQAIDREVHQHHYHTTVQPIHDRQVLPEKHVHQAGKTEHREFHHDDEKATRERLATEAANFKNTKHIGDVQHSQSAAPIKGSEHHHHHFHETVQPVIHKETIQPTVIHTTKPIHETHHVQDQHHGSTILPPITMDQLKQQGGHLGNHKPRLDTFEGEPDLKGGRLAGQGASGTTFLTKGGSKNTPLFDTNRHGNGTSNGAVQGLSNGHDHNTRHGKENLDGDGPVIGSIPATKNNFSNGTDKHQGREKESIMTKIKKVL
jgi:hypothetical protein